MDFVTLEFPPDAVCPREQIKNVRRVFKLEKRPGLIACDLAAVQNPMSHFRNARLVVCVKHVRCHG
jgi:hypothetical protein